MLAMPMQQCMVVQVLQLYCHCYGNFELSITKQNRIICLPGLAFQRDLFCAVSLVLALSQDSPSLAMRRRGAAQGC